MSKPALLIKSGAERFFPGKAFGELLQAILDKGGAVRFQVKGSSMFPFLRDEDIVTVIPIHGRPIRIGDIAVYIHAETGKPILHRVVRCKNGFCVVKGDNISACDGKLPETRLLGVVVRVERKGRAAWAALGPIRYPVVMLSRWNFPFRWLTLFKKLKPSFLTRKSG